MSQRESGVYSDFRGFRGALTPGEPGGYTAVMSPLFLRHLIAELAPRIAGAVVTDVRSLSASTVLLELAPAAGQPRGARRLLTVAADPPGALFLSDGGIPGAPPKERTPLERELRGASIAGLTQAGTDPRAVLTLACRDEIGRERSRALTADLGRRPGLAFGDETAGAEAGAGAARKRSTRGEPAGAATPTLRARGEEPPDHGPVVPTVSWRRDPHGGLRVRMTASAPEGDVEDSRAFATFNDAAAFAYSEFVRTLAVERRRRQVTKLATAELDRKLRAVAKVQAEIEESARAGEYRHKAGLLLARKDSVRKRESPARVLDYDNSTVVEIEINPALSVAKNAEVLFGRAKRAERRRTKAPARLAQLEPEVAKLRKVLEGVRGADEGALASMEARLAPPRRERAAGRPAPPGERARFRTYTVSGGWQVLVGKSNQDNDVLTHKIARPDDLWFHARQAAGSHVVLRKSGTGREPDKAAILEAAAIAAYHSKAGKSGRVAVCYTERKHVRKPRGGKPGLAVVTREKVVMVAPKVPEE